METPLRTALRIPTSTRRTRKLATTGWLAGLRACARAWVRWGSEKYYLCWYGLSRHPFCRLLLVAVLQVRSSAPHFAPQTQPRWHQVWRSPLSSDCERRRPSRRTASVHPHNSWIRRCRHQQQVGPGEHGQEATTDSHGPAI